MDRSAVVGWFLSAVLGLWLAWPAMRGSDPTPTDFELHPDSVLAVINRSLEAREWEVARQVSAHHIAALEALGRNGEPHVDTLRALRSAAEEGHLFQTTWAIPRSDLEGNLHGYQRLVAMAPEVLLYRQKVEEYQRRIDERAAAARRRDAERERARRDQEERSYRAFDTDANDTPIGDRAGDGYINSRGNWVPSPRYSVGIPSGASAQCRDGTYSSSRSRRGTCSHHGGVATWL